MLTEKKTSARIVRENRNRVDGIATCYGLGGPGIRSMPISAAERYKERFCSLGLRARIPPGAWISVLCVTSKSRQSRQRNKYGKKSTKIEKEEGFREKAASNFLHPSRLALRPI